MQGLPVLANGSGSGTILFSTSPDDVDLDLLVRRIVLIII